MESRDTVVDNMSGEKPWTLVTSDKRHRRSHQERDLSTRSDMFDRRRRTHYYCCFCGTREPLHRLTCCHRWQQTAPDEPQTLCTPQRADVGTDDDVLLAKSSGLRVTCGTCANQVHNPDIADFCLTGRSARYIVRKDMQAKRLGIWGGWYEKCPACDMQLSAIRTPLSAFYCIEADVSAVE